MKHLAAYALLVLGGKEKPTAADVDKLLKDAGVKGDAEKSKELIKAMDGKAFNDVAKAGLDKMATMGGGGAPAAGGAKAGGKAAVEEEKPKEDEPEDVDMGGLFGDEDDY
jgi:large subunit ribosomal protein LP2